MVKLFRNVRQRLLRENRFSRYLLYAIGEIILVVIGILIALSINNWNANRMDRHKETVYLSNIERDLKEQLASIDAQMKYEHSVIDIANPMIVNYKSTHEFKVDSTFTASIGRLTGRRTFVKNNPTYIELLSSGNIDIIANDSLKNALVSYYQQMELMEQIINKNNNLFTDAVFIPEVLPLTEVQLTSIYDTDLSKGLFSNIPADISNTMTDLNEESLKDITRLQLKVPEKQLLLINAINFRYQLSIIHYTLLIQQQKRTQDLLTIVSGHD
ncbi:MAG: DUF6090 family protein [Gelidibacter sp.]